MTSWLWCVATDVCCPCKVQPSAANRQGDLGKILNRVYNIQIVENQWTFHFETLNPHQECHQEFTYRYSTWFTFLLITHGRVLTGIGHLVLLLFIVTHMNMFPTLPSSPDFKYPNDKNWKLCYLKVIAIQISTTVSRIWSQLCCILACIVIWWDGYLDIIRKIVIWFANSPITKTFWIKRNDKFATCLCPQLYIYWSKTYREIPVTRS